MVELTRHASVGDVLEAMENRHDFTKMIFTLELFRHVLFKLVPDIIFHTQNQDEEQIRDNYDRASLPFSARRVLPLIASGAERGHMLSPTY